MGIRAGSVSVDTVVYYAAGPVPASAQSIEALQEALTSNPFVLFTEPFLSQTGMPSLVSGSISVIRSEDPAGAPTLAPTPAPTLPEIQPTPAPTTSNFQDDDDSAVPTGDGVGEEGDEEEEMGEEEICRAIVDASASDVGAGEDACTVMRACGGPPHPVGEKNCETCRSISADLQVAQEAGLLADTDVDIFCRNTSEFLDR